MKEKKIAIVHDWLVKYGGAERVLEILCEIFPDASIYTLNASEAIIESYFSGKIVHQSFISRLPRFIKSKTKLLLPLLPTAIEGLDLRDYDIVISNSNSFAHGIITKPETTHICYCHSPMRYAWDWKNEYQEENKLRRSKKIFINLLLNWIRLWDYYSSKRVDVWLANSNNVALRVNKYYRVSSKTLYPPIDMAKFKTRAIKENYFLILSRLEPYKKIHLAVKAFNKLNLPLVIIGEGSEFRNLKKIANDNITFMGFQSDQVVREYLSGARALIFPGEEDFGLVPVEAMASGTPIIAFKKGGVTETVKENLSGMFFEEQSVDSLIETISMFTKCEDNFDHLRIRESVSCFDKPHFVKMVKEIIGQL